MSTAIAAFASVQGTEPVAASGDRAGAASATLPPPADSPVTQTPLRPNPSFRIDAALGIVVMQFSNEAGQVSSTIPTAQQLAAYHRAAGAAHASPATYASATHASVAPPDRTTASEPGMARTVAGGSSPAAPIGSPLMAASMVVSTLAGAAALS